VTLLVCGSLWLTRTSLARLARSDSNECVVHPRLPTAVMIT
jgi:hypothetical protein